MPTPRLHPIIILGAGLSGLTLAYRLSQRGQECLVLEARNRLGGRILTSRTAPTAALELGATWLGQKHGALVALLEELGLATFEQVTGGRAIYEAISTSPPQVVQLPPNEEPTLRIAGGTDTLIQKLATALPPDCLQLETHVEHLELLPDGLAVHTNQGEYRAARVVSTLPPNLLVSTVHISPPLPAALREIAETTHTWMGESIKVGLRYAHPFWRSAGGPGGTIFSNVGPVSEMYDHSNLEDNHYALKGFLNGVYYSLRSEERRAMVLDQLRKYYGPVVDEYLAYEEGVWRQEPFTFAPYASHILPHQHNGHPVFRQPYLEGRLLLAGSETADEYPGYMDGAVRSAEWAAQQCQPFAEKMRT